MARWGMIGLGTMGQPMARRLLAAGHGLTFMSRRDEVAREFVAAGAERVASPAEVMAAAEGVITIVTADPQVEQVALGPRGLVEGASAGKLWIDMSTISPATIRRLGQELASRGVATLDAPVSGGPWGAADGSLAIMVGGAPVDFARARGVLEVLGKHIFHLGPLGAGQTAKLVNQVLAGGVMTLIAEGLALGKAGGLDLAQLADVISASSGNSAMFEARARQFLLAGKYPPKFSTTLMRKDLGLAQQFGESLGVEAPVSRAVFAQYTAAMALGQAEADFAAVARVVERASNVSLGPVAEAGPSA